MEKEGRPHPPNVNMAPSRRRAEEPGGACLRPELRARRGLQLCPPLVLALPPIRMGGRVARPTQRAPVGSSFPPGHRAGCGLSCRSAAVWP